LTDIDAFCKEADKLIVGCGTVFGTRRSSLKNIVKKLSTDAVIKMTVSIGNNFYIHQIQLPIYKNIYLLLEHDRGRIGAGEFLSYDKALDQFWSYLTEEEFCELFGIDWVEKPLNQDWPTMFGQKNKFENSYRQRFISITNDEIHKDAKRHLSIGDPRAEIIKVYDQAEQTNTGAIYQVKTPLFSEAVYFSWFIDSFPTENGNINEICTVQISNFQTVEFFSMFHFDDMALLRWLHSTN
jgi:hypothetical protein